MRLLAVADEVTDALWGDALEQLHPDLIVSCGDLPNYGPRRGDLRLGSTLIVNAIPYRVLDL